MSRFIEWLRKCSTFILHPAFRRREKTMDSLPNPKAVKKLFYLLTKEQSEDWTNRRMKGCKKAWDQLEEMFEQCYGTNRNQQDQSSQEEIPEIGNTQL